MSRAGRHEALRLRVIVSLFLVPLALTAIWSGGLLFRGIIGVGALLIAWEWARLTGLERSERILALAVLATLAATVTAFPHIMATWSGFCFFLGAAILLFAAGHHKGAATWQWQGVGLAYIAPALLGIVWLREQDAGRLLVLWVFLVVWATDIGGYFVGRALGGPRLAPRLSPNKTWSGFLGGVALAATTGMIIAALTGLGQIDWFLLASASLALVSQMGDLFESALKRQFGAKDSGGLLPGHGGVMDRLDGLMFAAPVAVAGVALSRSL